MKKELEIKWSSEPQAHDYPAALSYLSLIYDEKTAKKFVSELQKAKVTNFKAKDIFRASALSLLGVSNFHVTKDQIKMKNGDKLPPILLVRDPVNGKVVVADGYHRVCAAYSFDEDAVVPCKIV